MKVALLLSGGIDSSVSLALIKEKIVQPLTTAFASSMSAKHSPEEIEVEAFYLKIWLQEELVSLGNCPWEEDLDYAKQVCKKYQVPLHVISLQNEYWEKVVTYTIKEIKKGHTPNPDVFCNAYIKFGCFLEYLKDKPFAKIVSGHYAKIKEEKRNVYLGTAVDSFKDQTYFLAYLNDEQLKKCWFPLGDYTKKEVRELAKKFQLPNSDRKDSQGVCFLGKIKFRDFIAFHLGEKEGDIINFDDGNVIGKHKGFWFYTIGQRQGLNLSGGPWYVVQKNIQKNIIYISSQKIIVDKEHQSFYIYKCNWLPGFEQVATAEKLLKGVSLKVKIRHGKYFYKCTLKKKNNNYFVKLTKVDQGIASGQIAVFYHDDLCIGAGTIRHQDI